MLKLKDEKFTTELPGQLRPLRHGRMDAQAEGRAEGGSELDGHQAGASPKSISSTSRITRRRNWPSRPARSQVTAVSARTRRPATKKALPAEVEARCSLPGPLYTWMGMNTDYPTLERHPGPQGDPAGDRRRSRSCRRPMPASSPKAYGVVPPGILGHRPASKFSYKPDEARALLKAGRRLRPLRWNSRRLPDQQQVAAARSSRPTLPMSAST